MFHFLCTVKLSRTAVGTLVLGPSNSQPITQVDNNVSTTKILSITLKAVKLWPLLSYIYPLPRHCAPEKNEGYPGTHEKPPSDNFMGPKEPVYLGLKMHLDMYFSMVSRWSILKPQNNFVLTHLNFPRYKTRSFYLNDFTFMNLLSVKQNISVSHILWAQYLKKWNEMKSICIFSYLAPFPSSTSWNSPSIGDPPLNQRHWVHHVRMREIDSPTVRVSKLLSDLSFRLPSPMVAPPGDRTWQQGDEHEKSNNLHGGF